MGCTDNGEFYVYNTWANGQWWVSFSGDNPVWIAPLARIKEKFPEFDESGFKKVTDYGVGTYTVEKTDKRGWRKVEQTKYQAFADS